MAATMVAGLASCGQSKDGSKSTDASANYTPEEQLLGDSLAYTYGQLMAVQAQQQQAQMKMQLTPDQQRDFSKSEFMKGVKAVAKIDTTQLDYVMGLQMGMQLWYAAKGMPAQLMVPAEMEKMLKAFEGTYNLDTISVSPYTYQELFQKYLNKAEQSAEAKRIEALENSTESVDNKAAGAAYADSLVNQAGYTRSESGLVYLIQEPGTGDKVAANSRVKLRYNGKHINGETFDQTREEPMTSYAGQFIKGFTEGLTLLGKGGKATIVIPGDLGYGPRGQKPSIGANETLVFDIEIVDIM